MLRFKTILILLLAAISRRVEIPGTLRLARRFVPPEYFRRHPVDIVIPYLRNMRIRVRPSSYLEWVIFFKGYYHAGILRMLDRILRPGDVAMDIGANIGQYGLFMCQRVGNVGKVVLCEPLPAAADRLEENLRLNRFRNAQVLRKALSNEVGSAELNIPAPEVPNQGNSTLAPTQNPDLTAKISVSVDTVDNLSRQLDLHRLDFIKIDTQGHDLAVLQGACGVLARHKPYISVRYDEGLYLADGASYKRFRSFADQEGYELYLVKDDGLESLAGKSRCPSGIILGMPKGRIGEII